MENAKLNFCDIGASALRSFLLLLFLLPLLSTSAQTVRFGQSKVSVQTAIEAIEKQTSYSVDYTGNLLNQKKLITVKKGRNSVKSVIRQIVGNDLSYSIQGRHIILLEKADEKKLFLTKKPVRRKVNSQQGAHTLKGVVIDNITNDPLIGATIKIKGQPGGTVTDLNGEFTLQNVSTSSELTVSYVGYKTRTVLAGDLAVMTIKMTSANDQVGEVVVVGAGTQRKVSVTGAITSVSGSELQFPSSSLTANFAGKLAGVVSMVNSGEPGSTSEFYIRGISTFGGRTTPLILLDGVEISTGDLNNIPAESIESFSILKDASATAIYGARGANGVMLITTKSGIENSRARINVTVENSITKPVNVVDYAGGATYMETYNEAIASRNPSLSPRYTQEQIDNTRSHVNPYVFPDVNWYGLMFKNKSLNQRANLNVQGGSSKVTYYMSLQTNHDSGILDVPKTYSFDNNFNRWFYTFQNNIAYKITSTTKIDLRMNAQIENEKSPNTSTSDLFQQIFLNNPVTYPSVFPHQDGDTHVNFGSAVMSSGRYYTNPYANMLSSFKEQNYSKLNIALNLEQKLDFITKGLSLTSLINFNSYALTYYTRSLAPYYYEVTNGSWNASNPDQFSIDLLEKGTDYISQSDIVRASDNTFYLDARLNYNHHFGNHSVTGLLMYMMREYRNGVLPNRNQGFSGRLTYDYLNKYLAEFNCGYNGTVRLAKGNRFEFFPAMSLGWVISSEKFWKPLEKYIDFLKLRTSYGLVGSDETGESAGASHFLYTNSVNMTGGYSFSSGYTGGYTLTSPIITAYAVENAYWERAKEFDFGADLHLFNQVDVIFDYYHNKRDRILMKRASFPEILGYGDAVPWSNIGKVDNRGIELSVNWQKKLTKDWSMDLRSNFTYVKNKYVYVDEPDYPYVWQTSTGKPLSRMVGYIAEGLFKDEADIKASPDQSGFGSTIMPGDIKYRDVNGDGKITSEDEVMLSPYGDIPRIQYGFGISMNYKKLDGSVFFNGSAQRNIMINGLDPFCANDTNDHNLMKWIADDHWSQDHPNVNAKYPRLGYLDSQIYNNRQPSSYWMRCANFLRFKTFEIGYTFPYCRVYLNGDNLAVWSPFKYWDPELWYNTYPLQRTFNIGVQFKF